MLDKKSVVPLYEQLKIELIKLITSGEFKSRSRFYSLAEITKKYNVSLLTANRVIEMLATDGYLKTSRGRRAIVTASRTRKKASSMERIAIFFYSKLPASTIKYEQIPWTSVIFSGVQEKLLEKKALWTMISAENPKDAVMRLEEVKDEHDAFICLSPQLEKEMAVAFEKLRRPYVLIQPSQPDHNFIAADYYAGSVALAEMAVQKNYKSFLYLFNDKNGNPEKMRGFLETLLRKDIPPQQIHLRIVSKSDDKNAAEVFEDFVNEQDKTKLFPLAVYSFSDRLSMPVLAACNKLGFKVPEEVGVAGSTGLSEIEECKPSLTTILTPMRKMGNAAVEMIFEMLSAGTYRIPGVKLDVKLIKRKSL